MSEKEKRIVEKLKDVIPNMSEFDKGYILGVAEEKSKSKNMEESEYDFLQDGISSLLSLNEDDLRMTLGYAIALRDKEQRR